MKDKNHLGLLINNFIYNEMVIQERVQNKYYNIN